MSLMRMGAQADVQVDEVARLIETDPSAAARLLKVVNSAYRGLHGRVSSINRAVVLLGVNGVRNVLLSMQAIDVFGKDTLNGKSVLFEIWKHCLAVASTAELIAESAGGMLPEDAFTAGLLHDVGKIALYTIARSKYTAILEEVAEKGVEISQAEREAFGTDHCEAGRYLAEKWGLPDALCRVAGEHHLLPLITDDTDPAALAVAIVSVADDVVRRQRLGFSGTPESWEPLENLFEPLGLDAESIENILSHIVERVSLRSAVIDADLPEARLYLESLQKANALLGSSNEELTTSRRELEWSNRRLAAADELNRTLGASFSRDEVLSGLAEAVHNILAPVKVITYWVDAAEGQVTGCVRSGSSAAKPFRISARKDTENDIGELASERDVLVHVVNELAGKLDLSTGLSSLVAGRFSFIGITVDEGQRAGILVESSNGHSFEQDDLRFFADAGTLFLQRALFEDRLRRERAKLVDSTSRSREFYEQLLNSRKLASIGRMAAGAAHEINNPLAIVSGRVQLLLKMEADGDKKHHLEMIRSQCERMSRIISDILTFGKPEKPVVKGVSVKEVIGAVVSLVEEAAAAKGVAITLELPARLPQISADSAKIEQALRNILANAVDASEEGSSVTITAELEEKDRYLAIEFADKGKGMDKATLENIFEPFFTTKAGTGTGLGLAICHSIVASHGGKIRVRSELGRGTVFRVLVPVWKGI